MSKFTIKKEEAVEAEVPAVELPKEVKPNFTRVLLGTYWDPQTGEWKFASVKFDPLTMQVSEVKEERVGGDHHVMMEQLHVKQIRLNFFEKDPVSE